MTTEASPQQAAGTASEMAGLHGPSMLGIYRRFVDAIGHVAQMLLGAGRYRRFRWRRETAPPTDARSRRRRRQGRHGGPRCRSRAVAPRDRRVLRRRMATGRCRGWPRSRPRRDRPGVRTGAVLVAGLSFVPQLDLAGPGRAVGLSRAGPPRRGAPGTPVPSAYKFGFDRVRRRHLASHVLRTPASSHNKLAFGETALGRRHLAPPSCGGATNRVSSIDACAAPGTGTSSGGGRRSARLSAERRDESLCVRVQPALDRLRGEIPPVVAPGATSGFPPTATANAALKPLFSVSAGRLLDTRPPDALRTVMLTSNSACDNCRKRRHSAICARVCASASGRIRRRDSLAVALERRLRAVSGVVGLRAKPAVPQRRNRRVSEPGRSGRPRTSARRRSRS